MDGRAIPVCLCWKRFQPRQHNSQHGPGRCSDPTCRGKSTSLRVRYIFNFTWAVRFILPFDLICMYLLFCLLGWSAVESLIRINRPVVRRDWHWRWHRKAYRVVYVERVAEGSNCGSSVVNMCDRQWHENETQSEVWGSSGSFIQRSEGRRMYIIVSTKKESRAWEQRHTGSFTKNNIRLPKNARWITAFWWAGIVDRGSQWWKYDSSPILVTLAFENNKSLHDGGDREDSTRVNTDR